jgi:outer membrane protein W
MFVRLGALAAFAVLLPTHVAMAQTQTAAGTSTGLIRQNLASNTIAVMSLTEEAQGGGSGADRKYIPRVFGGLWLGDEATGFTLGAGVSLHPFTDARHEIQGNLAYNRVEGTNGFGLDVDYLFNFLDTQAGEFTPYAGGGLNFTRFSSGDCGDVEELTGIDLDCSDSEAALQIGGGAKKTLASGKDFFVEGYIVLFDSTAFILRAGLGW